MAGTERAPGASRTGRDLLAAVADTNNFMNTYVAHQEKELTDAKLAEKNLRQWIQVLRRLSEPECPVI